jgi:hypothetical protein
VNPQENTETPPAGVFVFPPGKARRAPKSFGVGVPTPLQRSYESAVLALAAENYVATAVCSRRTLEGIFKYALPSDKQNLPLAKAIEAVNESTDLSAPLRLLAHAIRQGGNLGAHFDAEREPTAELAQQMVDLLEYLIEFLYSLPRQITDLEEQLSSSPPAEVDIEPAG